DTVELARESAAAIGTERRSETLSRRELAASLEAFADGAPIPTAPDAWPARLAELETHARTLADVAAATLAERGDGADSELGTWAQALQRTVASHARDLDLFPPREPGGPAGP